MTIITLNFACSLVVVPFLCCHVMIRIWLTHSSYFIAVKHNSNKKSGCYFCWTKMVISWSIRIKWMAKSNYTQIKSHCWCEPIEPIIIGNQNGHWSTVCCYLRFHLNTQIVSSNSFDRSLSRARRFFFYYNCCENVLNIRNNTIAAWFTATATVNQSYEIIWMYVCFE